MASLISAYRGITTRLEAADWLLPTLARLVFAGVLLVYFLNSGLTKLGDGFAGIFAPSDGAYVQMFPKAMEAAGYDSSALSFFHYLVALAGTWAEFILPVLIVLGLFTRFAALGMIGFVVVQSLTDVYGHGAAWGAWFDRFSDAVIVDQRAMWFLLLLTLVIKGAGPISFDRAITPKSQS
jgi:putative oxidoreductase